MMHVLIVEEDAEAASNLATMLKHHVDCAVVGLADDLYSAVRIARSANVHISFINVHLPRLDTAYRIADELVRLGTTCVFITRTVEPFPMPGLAAAWLRQPYTLETVGQALGIASAELQVHASSTMRH
jgi:chemotaxis response regulator CheB